MAYNSPGNITTGTEIFSWINDITEFGAISFFPLMIIAVFIISLIKMMTNPANTSSKAFAAASFVSMIFAVLARTIDLVSTGFMSVFVIMTAAGAIWMHFENTEG